MVFNQMLPLKLWVQAMEGSILPDHLCLLVARAAWVRFILRNREGTAMAAASFLKARDALTAPSMSVYQGRQKQEGRPQPFCPS